MVRKMMIFDIDGVLADDRHREHFAGKDWAAYFDVGRMAQDAVYDQGRFNLMLALLLGCRIAYLTGRREDRREVTEAWLRDNGFPVGPETPLIMRPLDDPRVLPDLKVAILAGEIPTDLDLDGEPFVLLDDDPRVILAVRERFGNDAAEHCTWHKKAKALMQAGQA